MVSQSLRGTSSSFPLRTKGEEDTGGHRWEVRFSCCEWRSSSISADNRFEGRMGNIRKGNFASDNYRMDILCVSTWKYIYIWIVTIFTTSFLHEENLSLAMYCRQKKKRAKRSAVKVWKETEGIRKSRNGQDVVTEISEWAKPRFLDTSSRKRPRVFRRGGAI